MSEQRKLYIVLLLFAGVAGFVGYSGLELAGWGGLAARSAEVQAKQDSITMLQARIDSAKTELARGSVEDLRRRLEGYRTSLDLLRRLVPEQNEVPNLLDAITTRAKIRGVEVAAFSPGAVTPGPDPFTTQRWDLKVYGHYDQIGEFLADVASLPRIVVPVDLKLSAAPAATAATYGDSTGAMLLAGFSVLTYVKSPQTEGTDGGQ
ncbi:MAG TPA: type 4a pilus biogenesis protein PilO [Gemmatimonadales bacterium]|nr:type 4a pilus biogenesis protein PilO [Gemmatimonadales bacterium]